MKKVLILGFSGSGKSTFAKQLGEAIKVPVTHLDTLYWKPGWERTNKPEWDKVITMLLEQEEYIIDGNYPGSLAMRLKDADTVFYFDLSIFFCLFRVLKRRLCTSGETATDRAYGCSEPINLLFFAKWVWNFRRRSRYRTKLVNELAQLSTHKNIIIFKNRLAVKKYVLQTSPREP